MANLSPVVCRLHEKENAQKTKEFRGDYYPYSDTLLTRINWESIKGFNHIPLEAQKQLFDRMGRDECITSPKPGASRRGAGITRDALENLIKDRTSTVIEIYWEKPKVDHSPHRRWIDYWREG